MTTVSQVAPVKPDLQLHVPFPVTPATQSTVFVILQAQSVQDGPNLLGKQLAQLAVGSNPVLQLQAPVPLIKSEHVP
jgi:hypothetical protein